MAPLSGSKAGEGKTTIARRGFGSLFASLDSGGESDLTCANPSISNWKKFLADCTLHWRVIVIEIENVVTRSGFTVQQVVTRRRGFLPERKRTIGGEIATWSHDSWHLPSPGYYLQMYVHSGVRCTNAWMPLSTSDERIYSKVLPLCIK